MILGFQGMPRRYHTYLPQFENGNFFAGIGGAIMIIGIFLMFFNLFRAMKRGKICSDPNPWGATTLEWTVASPPHWENFEGPIVVKEYPYDFSEIVAKFKK
jgi:cytochrome c oxidase subunit 1